MSEFGEELKSRSGLVLPEGVEIDSTAYDIAATALVDIDNEFGMDSAYPREHHNAPHGIDHVVRDMVLINPVFELIPEQYQEHIRELGVVDGALHDRYQHLKKLGVNEIFSAAYGVNLINDHGSNRINTGQFKARSADGVISTTTFVRPDGSLVQPYLLEGDPDAHKFFMVAADVYAPIAMGGVYEMLKTSRNLTLEERKNPSPVDGYNFVASEVAFIKQELNPKRLMKVIAHFFPDSAEEVYSIYFDLYNHNIVAASEFAQAVDERPDKAEEIGEALFAEEFEEIGEIAGKEVKRPET